MPFFDRVTLLAFSVAISLGIVGCGESGPVRYAVSGKVTNNGTGVSAGRVSFIPQKEAKALKAVGTVTQGEFTILEENGPEEAAYTIRVVVGEPVKPSKAEPGAKGAAFQPKSTTEKLGGIYEFDVNVGPENLSFDLDISKAKK